MLYIFFSALQCFDTVGYMTWKGIWPVYDLL